MCVPFQRILHILCPLIITLDSWNLLVPTFVFNDYLRRVFCSNKDRDCHWKSFARNLAAQSAVNVSFSIPCLLTGLCQHTFGYWYQGGTTCPSIGFVCALDYAKNNNIKVGERQFNCLVDVYKKTLRSDGIAGLYRGFNTACVGKIVFGGLYFGMTNSLIKPVVLNSESPQVGSNILNSKQLQAQLFSTSSSRLWE